MPIGILPNKKYNTIRIGGSTNNFHVDSGGNVTLNGEGRTWTDFSVPGTAAKLGIMNKPDFDYTNLGLLFPQNDESEKIYITYQMLHQKSFNTSLKFHIHYIQSAAQQPIFELQYKFYNNNSLVPGSWNTIDTSLNKGIYTWSSGNLLQIAKFPEIDAPSNESLSANLDVMLYRQTGDGLAGDVLLKYADFHYTIDGFGSNEEYVK